jgi:hypothetical protein
MPNAHSSQKFVRIAQVRFDERVVGGPALVKEDSERVIRQTACSEMNFVLPQK